MTNSPDRYNLVAISLHWLIAALMIPMLFFGENMIKSRGDITSTLWPSIHVSVGAAILLLTIARLLWRLTNAPPELPATMANWERLASKSTHVIFYALLVGLPLTGWLAFEPYLARKPGLAGTNFFGLLPVPGAPDLGEIGGGLHSLGSNAGIALVVLHVAAALKHQFINQDGVLRRMLPF